MRNSRDWILLELSKFNGRTQVKSCPRLDDDKPYLLASCNPKANSKTVQQSNLSRTKRHSKPESLFTNIVSPRVWKQRHNPCGESEHYSRDQVFEAFNEDCGRTTGAAALFLIGFSRNVFDTDGQLRGDILVKIVNSR